MRPYLIILLSIWISTLSAQYQYIQTEVLDSEERAFKPFSAQGNKTVRFALMRKTVDDQVKNYVQVEIGNIVATEMTSSSGMIIANGIGFASSSSVTTETRVETFILNKEDLGAIKDFLNNSIKKKSDSHEHSIGYSIKVQDKLMVTLLYDPAGKFKWKYLISILDVQFDTTFEDGLSLMRKLVEYHGRL